MAHYIVSINRFRIATADFHGNRSRSVPCFEGGTFMSNLDLSRSTQCFSWASEPIRLQETTYPILVVARANKGMYSCCSCYVSGSSRSGYFFANCVKCSAILNCCTKTTQPRSKGFSVVVPFPGNYHVLSTSFSRYCKRLPNLVNASWLWRMQRDFDLGFNEPIRNGQIFWRSCKVIYFNAPNMI